MGLLDYLKRLSGEGAVRLVIETSDGKRQEIKVTYTGDPGSVTETEYLDEIVAMLRVEHGLKVHRIKVDSIHGTGQSQPNWSMKWYTVKRRDE